MAKTTNLGGGKLPWTEDQMQKWAATGAYTGSCEHDGETLRYAFSKPPWPVMKRVSSLVNQGDNATAGEVLLENCWLAGDDRIKGDPVLYLGACLSAVNIVALNIPTFTTELVKP